MATYPLSSPGVLALAEFPSLSDSLLFQVNGLVVVFLALSSIWGAMELMGLFFRLRPAPVPAPVQRVAAPSASPPLVPPAAAAPDDAVMAVIAAAVCATTGPCARILAVTPATEGLDWAREGRRAIFASHQPR